MKPLFLYNLNTNEERLVSEIQLAHEWKDSLNICSTLGMEVSETVRDALLALLQDMSKSESRYLTLSLGGCRFNCNLAQVVKRGNELSLLEKISIDDADFIPSIVGGVFQNSQLREISLCIASPAWKESAALDSLCQVLNTTSSKVECLRIRTWTYIDNFYRNNGNMPDTSSWDNGVDPILEAIVGNISIKHLQLQLQDTLSPSQTKSTQTILSHPNCRIAKLDLRIQKMRRSTPSTSNLLECILSGIICNTYLKCFHLCGWKMNSKDAESLLKALQVCRHIEGFKFDRSMLECDRNQFFTKLLQLDFLKSISSYSNSWNLSPPKRYDDLDMDVLCPAITQNTTLEALKLRNMNVSTSSMNKLLKQLDKGCPKLKVLKIINVSKTALSGGKQEEILEPIQCGHIEKLHLMGFPPFACKRRRDTVHDERIDWFRHALETNPCLYSFGPGESYGLTRFLQDVPAELLQLADHNRFGRVLTQRPGCHSLWPVVLENINTRIDDDKERQATAIYGVLSKCCFSSFQTPT
eukprot:scaffold22680_cov107-Cylindrotheca_fusiformis.AAC.33